ncbi:hypothetical protein [Nocardia pneumoniae]|uniref:hypothetical protein n=1 Tax=Nocardia pneumoniae TaxID=228601 RepID=UPI001C3F2FDA|nr:hypothetical protein [Nocardia pneumoniae]
MTGLVCPHHLVDARHGLASRNENPCCKRGTRNLDEGMIALALPEIWRLLIALVLTRLNPADHIWGWSRWRRRRQRQARLSYYRRRGHPLT